MSTEQPTHRYAPLESPIGEIIEDFRETVDAAVTRLGDYSDADAAIPTAAGKWSRKEILGHLIDSASNNHGRFVRIQFADRLSLPGYQQNEWVAAGGYQESSWEDLVQLWSAYNRQLIRLVSQIPDSALGNVCSIKDSEPLTLHFIIADYVAHMQHHLHQIF